MSTAWVYPRAYGETDDGADAHVSDEGLSPRIRGNRVAAKVFSSADGSIPAHTGKPVRVMAAWIWSRVYPRAYGETYLLDACTDIKVGLSPRIRGNPQ